MPANVTYSLTFRVHVVHYHRVQADVWSAGVILFMMLSGNLPMERAASHHWWFDVLNVRANTRPASPR